jgi:hypothetical protein
MKRVAISDSYMLLLQDYSKRTDVDVARCVSDALSGWLANVAPQTLDHAGQEPLMGPTRRQNLLFMKSRSHH